MNLLYDPVLVLYADALDDLERTRIANENRYRQLTRTETDIDGGERGFGYSSDLPEVKRLALIIATLAQCEHDAVLSLQKRMRAHPLGPWVKAQRGVGDKQAARLLAAIGDPYWNTLKDEPRTVSQLWAYCGLHVLTADQTRHDALARPVGGQQAPGSSLSSPDGGSTVLRSTAAAGLNPAGSDTHRSSDAQVVCGVAVRLRKGQRANWSTLAKTRAYLIATSCIKQPESPYREVYDARRAHTTTTHPDWTPGHSHADGLRIVSKAVLRDLWREAKRLHEQQQPVVRPTPTACAAAADHEPQPAAASLRRAS